MSVTLCSGRTAAVRLWFSYSAALTLSHTMAAAEVVVIAVSLGNGTVGPARSLITMTNLWTVIALTVVGAIAGSLVAVLTVAPSVRWFIEGGQPDAAQRRAALRIPGRQSVILLATWMISGAAVIIVNVHAGVGVALLIGSVTVFGGTSTACLSYLLTWRTLRPIITSAMENSVVGVRMPGVLARLILMWALGSALPTAGIAALVLGRRQGWIIEPSASVDLPVLVVSVVALLFGLRALIVVSQSISAPLHEVIAAMADVERGNLQRRVGVYDPSEIGALQRGFNQMVAGLAERDRLRDLFGRHVGIDVARYVARNADTMSGEVRDVAVLFVDMVGSTQLATTLAPEEMASILNQFFDIVVHAVDDRGGFINKFIGDAALAVFGAPEAMDDAASAALSAARRLGADLRRLLAVDFGIGVCAGPVFAGNIGARNRYEYTVVGDTVNQAARLADCAKVSQPRVLCSTTAIDAAEPVERRHWEPRGSMTLRGRADPTEIFGPVAETFGGS
jgi:class 3 adenylate cyclase